LPASGPIVPEWSEVGDLMRHLMAENGTSAGTLAVMQDSKLVLREGFGWVDAEHTMVVHPDNLFRIASVSKPMTKSAIIKLIKEGKLSDNTPVYSYLGIQPWGGHLGDDRIPNITVKNLEEHSGGWLHGSESSACVFQTPKISKEMGLTHPATARDVISWQFSKPLDFTPGTTNEYCNFGYQILGRVIEKASGKRYIDYIQQDLLGMDVLTNPIGFKDIALSRSHPQDRAPWEIWYSPNSVQNIDSFDAFGGISASAMGLCKYMLHYWVCGDRRWPNENYRWLYTFSGSLSGVNSRIYQDIRQHDGEVNGLEMVLLFNGKGGMSKIQSVIQDLVKKESWIPPSGEAIEWNMTETNVMAGDDKVTVQLVRSSSDSSLAKVSYTTYSRTAITESYVPQSGVVTFAPGETHKNVTIKLNSVGKIPKAFLLELISASNGGWIGDRRTCIVKISNNNKP